MENNFTDAQFNYMVQGLRANVAAVSDAKKIEEMQRAQTNVLRMVDSLASRGVVSMQQPDGSWRRINSFEIQNLYRGIEGEQYITIRKSPADDPFLISMDNNGLIHHFSRGQLNFEQFLRQTTGLQEPRKPGFFASIGNWFHKRFNNGEPSETFRRYYEQRDAYQIRRYDTLTKAGFRIGKPAVVEQRDAQLEAQRQERERQEAERENEQRIQELDQQTVEPEKGDLVDQLNIKMFQGVLHDRFFAAGSGTRNQSNIITKSNAFEAALRKALDGNSPEAAKLKGIVEGWVNGAEQESLRNAFDAFDMNHPETLTDTILNPPTVELPDVTKREKEQQINQPQNNQPQNEMNGPVLNGPVLEGAGAGADVNDQQNDQQEDQQEEKQEEINNQIDNPVPPQVNTPVQTPIFVPDEPGQQEVVPPVFDQPQEQQEESLYEEQQPEQQQRQPEPEPVLGIEPRTFKPDEVEKMRQEDPLTVPSGTEGTVDPAEQAKAAAFYEVLNNATAGESAEARELRAFLEEDPEMLENMYRSFDVNFKEKLAAALAEQAKVLVEESNMVNEDNAPLADAADMSKVAAVNGADAPGAKGPEQEIINKVVPDEAQAPLAEENGKEKTAEAIAAKLENRINAYIIENVATMNPDDAAKEIGRKEAFVNTWKAAMTGNTGKALFIKNFVEKRMDENPAMFEEIYDGFNESKIGDMKALFDIFYKDEMVSENINQAAKDPEITALTEKIADRLAKDPRVKDLNDEKKEAFIETMKYTMSGKGPAAEGTKKLFTEYLKTQPGNERDRYLSDLYNRFDMNAPHLTAERVQSVFDPKVSTQEISKSTNEFMPPTMIIKTFQIRTKALERINQQNDLAAAKAVENPSKKMDPLTMGPK